MSTPALPLPLELTKPVTLAADLDTQLRESLGVGKYDPKTQLSQWYNHRGSSSNGNCGTVVGAIVQVDGDVQVDDNL